MLGRARGAKTLFPFRGGVSTRVSCSVFAGSVCIFRRKSRAAVLFRKTRRCVLLSATIMPGNLLCLSWYLPLLECTSPRVLLLAINAPPETCPGGKYPTDRSFEFHLVQSEPVRVDIRVHATENNHPPDSTAAYFRWRNWPYSITRTIVFRFCRK